MIGLLKTLFFCCDVTVIFLEMKSMNRDLYVSTYLGNRFYPFEGRIEAIDIEDIAHGLAYQCRFNGQTRAFYSVAQHSLLVADLLEPELKLAGLLHDAAEAYLGDMVKPLKLVLPEFSAIEDRISQLINRHFGIADLDHRAIKRADLTMLATEKRDLMPHSTEAWASIKGFEPLPFAIAPMLPEEAKAAFLTAFDCYRF